MGEAVTQMFPRVPAWGRGRPRWHWGQRDTGAAQLRVLLKVPDSAGLCKNLSLYLMSVRELWNSLPCLLPEPSAITFRLSFPFYTLSPHCQVPSIPNSLMDQCCSQHPTLSKTRQMPQWLQRHLLSHHIHLSHKWSHLGFTFSNILIRGLPLIFLGTLNDPGEAAGMLNLL